MEERTGWRGQNESQTEGEEKRQTCWCCRDQQRACRMAQASAETLNLLGLLKRSGLSATERAVGKYARATLAKEKEQSRLSRVADREGEKSQGWQEPHLGKKEGDQSESIEKKRWTPLWRKADFKEEREDKQEELL